MDLEVGSNLYQNTDGTIEIAPLAFMRGRTRRRAAW